MWSHIGFQALTVCHNGCICYRVQLVSACLLFSNDLTVRDWARLDDRYDRAGRDYKISGLKDMFTMEIVRHHNVQDVFSGNRLIFCLIDISVS